jgi:hypothetical protein
VGALEQGAGGEAFGPKREEVAGGWRKLHNEKLHDLYFHQNIIRLIKSRGMRWAGQVSRMMETGNAKSYGFIARWIQTTWKN